MGRGGMAVEDTSPGMRGAASRRATWKHGETHASRVAQLGFIEVHPRSVSFKVGITCPPRPPPPPLPRPPLAVRETVPGGHEG